MKVHLNSVVQMSAFTEIFFDLLWICSEHFKIFGASVLSFT